MAQDIIAENTCASECFTVAPSSIPGGAGMGLFANEDIEALKILGEYSGTLLGYAELGAKMQRTGVDDLYPFWIAPGQLVDPTMEDGHLDPETKSMGYVNEAPVGTSFNAIAVHRADRPGAYFIARCKILAGSELFVCYAYDMAGREYDIETADPEADKLVREQIAEKYEGAFKTTFDTE
eukprot:TRINITY_DN19258_c0_g1_i1.p1 TRINITY_DN19258_c0_g1~~TRINITY_DN19258_c0_g1_i1.p1  ORF type:complete len:191 (+),score=34.86 TRINITY_DN19258_c0_g1_i1:36-575(+)